MKCLIVLALLASMLAPNAFAVEGTDTTIKCESLFTGGDSYLQAFAYIRTRSANPDGFEQRRTTFGIETLIADIIASLPKNSIIVDFGAGLGLAVAATVYGNGLTTKNRQGYSDVNPQDNADARKEKFKHLNLIGITATPESQIPVPLVGPDGRYELLAGRLFEEIPDSEILDLIKKLAKDAPDARVFGFSQMGIWEYSKDPKITFQKFHTATPIGSEVFLHNEAETSYILPDGQDKLFDVAGMGRKIGHGDYAKLSGFEVTRVIWYRYRSRPWEDFCDQMGYMLETDPRFPEQIGQQIKRGDAWGVTGWIIKNTENVKMLPVTVKEEKGGNPPTLTFQIGQPQ